MSKNWIIVLAWMLAMFIVVACGFSFGDTVLSDEEKLQTAVAATVSAIQPSPVIPTQAQPTAEPAKTQTVPPTKTPIPCNLAYYVSETIPDGTEYDVGESFVKTWRLKNIGTCTWNSNYQLVFAEGDKMSGPSSQNLTQSVAPGEQIDISVDLIAPNIAGTYKGIWKVKDDQGAYIVHKIWVEIKANAILAPPPVGKPDLVVSEFSINPAPPIWHDNTHVHARAKNQGTADSGGFKMDWYGLTTAAIPSCTWNIAGGLVAGGSVLMECDYMFGSWYPVNKTSIVYIDTNNTVDESNESNNTATISPFGVVTPTP